MRVYYSLIAVTSSVFILNEPASFVCLLLSFHIEIFSPNISWIFMWLVFINSAMTPIWYYSFSTPMKTGYQSIVKKLVCKSEPEVVPAVHMGLGLEISRIKRF